MQVKEKEDHSLILVNEDKTFQIRITFDGCYHIENFCNGYNADTEKEALETDNRDYMHICDINVFIKELQDCRHKAIKHFNNEFHN